MLDINLIKQNPEKTARLLKNKGWEVDFDRCLKVHEERLSLVKNVEELKAEKNKLSASVPVVKKNGGDIEEIFAKVKSLNSSIYELDLEIAKLEEENHAFLSELPNIPDEDLHAGGKENNEVIKTFGTRPSFDFKIKNHVELCETLDIIDYSRGAKISGAGTWIYKGLGAQLEWALLNFFISEHLKDGYEMIMPPHILNKQSGFVAGQFPKFTDDVFYVNCKPDDDNAKFLLPTAETALVNIHRDEILNENELPKKYFAYTPCYRTEIGSYRAEERGMVRGYQFNKVELVQYSTAENSDQAFDELVKKAETILEKLGLHYQTSRLAAGDISHAMARTFDIEIFIPSMGIYKEVSSASNARDYQARRGNMRYRDTKSGKNKFIHTLNASGLATSRIFPAILEQNQQSDGSVIIPKVLRPFMNGVERITPKQFK